jgi:hypothetical protein
VVIKGKVLDVNPDEDPRLTINFSTSDRGYDSPSIPCHMAFRFKEGSTVLNTKNNGEWGKEVHKKLPIKVGEEFDIRIRFHEDKYEVMVDQKDFAEYEHRNPLNEVSHIFIDGPIVLQRVTYGGQYYKMPYSSDINVGPGKRLLMSGVPDKGCDRFHINLVTRNGDTALQFNPRFNEKDIIRNSKIGGEWGTEEREGKFTMVKNQAVDICIQNEEYSFQVYINEEHYCAFAHRIPPDQVSSIEIDGEFDLQSVLVV